MKLVEFTTPTALIEGRMQALVQGDFNLIYDSYYAAAPFLSYFPEKAEYLAFADQQLCDISLVEWKILNQRQVSRAEVEVLLWMRMDDGAVAQDFFELALLIRADSGWRYHSAQKLTREDYSGAVDEINFHHFDHAAQKIRF